MKIIIEIDDLHLAALDAISDRYSVGRNQMVALLVTAAVKREEAADERQSAEVSSGYRG